MTIVVIVVIVLVLLWLAWELEHPYEIPDDIPGSEEEGPDEPR